jgi:hypothetical protein
MPVVTTDAEIKASGERSKLEPKTADAVSAEYLPDRDFIAVLFDNGIEVRFPRMSLRGLESATPAQIANVKIDVGDWLLWPDLDVDHYIPQLMDGFTSSCRVLAEIGRVGGSKTSPAKAAAGRANGKKGGRPKKRVHA